VLHRGGQPTRSVETIAIRAQWSRISSGANTQYAAVWIPGSDLAENRHGRPFWASQTAVLRRMKAQNYRVALRCRCFGYNDSVTLRLCSDLSAADWLTTSSLAWDKLVTFGPSGFAAYARLLLLPDPQYPGQSENDAATDDELLPELEQLRAACSVLADHTRTPDDCYLCLWDGWGFGDEVPGPQGHGMPLSYGGGGQHVTLEPAGARPGMAAGRPVRHEPKVVVPNRTYSLFRGNISDLGDWSVDDTWTQPPRPDTPPAFVWPADRAWCISNDVDPHWIGVAASTRAVDQLAAHPALDVVHADPHEDPPHYQ
jgi:hypothetical protein